MIDAERCAGLLRQITDTIATSSERPDLRGDITSLIAWIRATGDSAAREIRRRLGDLHPEIGWVGEDGAPDTMTETHWVYDPIDGAYHFLQGLPLWSSSLALVSAGRCRLALVYDPTLGELFLAEAGKGATLNGERITTSQKTTLTTVVLGSAIPPLGQVGCEQHRAAHRVLEQVSRRIFVVRQMASTSLQLAYTAAGRLDGYFELGRDIPDLLAGALLVAEAGGRVTDLRRCDRLELGERAGRPSDGTRSVTGGA